MQKTRLQKKNIERQDIARLNIASLKKKYPELFCARVVVAKLKEHGKLEKENRAVITSKKESDTVHAGAVKVIDLRSTYHKKLPSSPLMHFYKSQAEKLLSSSRPEPAQKIAGGNNNAQSSPKAKLNWKEENPDIVSPSVSRRTSRMYSMAIFCIQCIMSTYVFYQLECSIIKALSSASARNPETHSLSRPQPKLFKR